MDEAKGDHYLRKDNVGGGLWASDHDPNSYVPNHLNVVSGGPSGAIVGHPDNVRPLLYQNQAQFPRQVGNAADDDDDDEDLDQLVPDEMDYTHEDSFKYRELTRQREAQRQQRQGSS